MFPSADTVQLCGNIRSTLYVYNDVLISQDSEFMKVLVKLVNNNDLKIFQILKLSVYSFLLHYTSRITYRSFHVDQQLLLHTGQVQVVLQVILHDTVL